MTGGTGTVGIRASVKRFHETQLGKFKRLILLVYKGLLKRTKKLIEVRINQGVGVTHLFALFGVARS